MAKARTQRPLNCEAPIIQTTKDAAPAVISSEIPTAGANPLRFLRRLYMQFPGERPALVACALGFLWFVARTALRGPRPLIRDWLDVKLGAMPALTVGWLLFCVLNYQMPPDSQPFLAIISFWSVWFVVQLGAALHGLPRSEAFRNIGTREAVL